jgi:hypothetical protein
MCPADNNAVGPLRGLVREFDQEPYVTVLRLHDVRYRCIGSAVHRDAGPSRYKHGRRARAAATDDHLAKWSAQGSRRCDGSNYGTIGAAHAEGQALECCLGLFAQLDGP